MEERMVIMGSAPCLFDDIEKAGVTSRDKIMAVNRAGLMYPGWIDFWATYHPEYLTNRGRVNSDWVRKREKIGGNIDYSVISHKPFGRHVDIVIDHPPVSGSSGFFGVWASEKLNYKNIVLVGMPLIHHRDRQIPAYKRYREEWQEMTDFFKTLRIRSMSGFTKDFLEGLKNDIEINNRAND